MALVVGTDTYITLVDADAYFASRYNSSAWIALNNSDKEILLRSATRALDVYGTWGGEKTDENQALEFPRDDEEIPENIKVAECEIANNILSSGSITPGTDPGLAKFKVDVIQFDFAYQDFDKTNTLYDAFVKRLLDPFIASYGAAGKLTRC